MELKKLNLGCGEDKKEGYVNIDWNKEAKPDIIHDLNAIPYPFSADEFDEILASHILEHLDKPFEIMKELHRILKPGGKLIVKVPHFSRGFTHAEHVHGFDITFSKYFDKNFTKSGYLNFNFETKRIKLTWLAFPHLLPYFGYGQATISILKNLSKIISSLANLNQAFCSRIWCYFVGGFEEIEFIFICKKNHDK